MEKAGGRIMAVREEKVIHILQIPLARRRGEKTGYHTTDRMEFLCLQKQ
jgi:hypothetical protein